MRFRHLIAANLLRKKIRTALAVGSFTVALFLFGILGIVRGVFSRFQDLAAADRLVILSKSLGRGLPIPYRDRLRRIPGVRDVTFAFGFPGYYQNERNFFWQIAVDVDGYRNMYPEYVISDEEWRAFAADREGCVVGEALARRFGWKIGDRVPLKRYMGSWALNIRGIYRGKRAQDDAGQFWFQWKFLQEKMLPGMNEARMFIVRVASPGQASAVARAIDEEFANSPVETRTSTESNFGGMIVKMIGNIEFLIVTIGAVVFFTLLLVTGNTMAIGVRERTGEFAVLKALGFSDRFVLVLILAETLVIAVLGGMLGLASARLLTWNGGPGRGLLPPLHLPGRDVVLGLLLAVLVGLISGLLPALSAMRLRVVEAMRRV